MHWPVTGPFADVVCLLLFDNIGMLSSSGYALLVRSDSSVISACASSVSAPALATDLSSELVAQSPRQISKTALVEMCVSLLRLKCLSIFYRYRS